MYFRAGFFKANHWAAEYWGGAGDEPPAPAPETSTTRRLTYGMGVAPKSAAHPHPRFNQKH